MDSYIKYNFPNVNPGPFDGNFAGNYFVFANGYSNLSGDISDFNTQTFEANIPTGYKTIIVCHRMALIEDSQVKREWIFESPENNRDVQTGGKYIITTQNPIQQFRTDWNQQVEGLSVFRPDAPDASIHSMVWDDLDKCTAYALTLINNSDNKALISVILDTISWH